MDNSVKIANIEKLLENIKNKENKVVFYVGHSVNGNTIASVLTTYKYALYLHNEGYNVIILHDKKDYKFPSWVGDEFKCLKHISLEGGKLSISPIDIVVYPETHPDVMEKTKTLNCTKVVLCQSYKNILSSLPPGLDWTSFGIDFIIVVSEKLKDYIKGIFHIDDIFIKTIVPSVDGELFYDDKEIFRCPVIPVVSRNQSDTLTLAKEFYLRYPEHKMVSFKDMRAFTMEDYATTLNESFLGVWLDRDASFGQFPIEAYKSNLPIIALKPEMEVQYDLKNITWVDSKLDIPKMIFERLIDYMNTYDSSEMIEDNIFTVDDESNKVINLFNTLTIKKENELKEYKERLNG